MFFRRRRKLNNNIDALGLPRAQKTEVIYQAVSYTGVVLVVVAFLLLSPFVAWWLLVGLFDALGEYRPEQAAARFLISGLTYLFSATLIIGCSFLFARYIVSLFFRHHEQMRTLQIELEQVRQRHVQALPPTTAHRMTGEQVRLYRAVMVAMKQGYGMVDSRGQLTGNVQPWSRRSVGSIRLLNEREPIGENTQLASAVKRYLLTRNILLDDKTINLTDFPNLNTVEVQLQTDFGQLVQVNGGDSVPYRQTYSIIN